MFDWSKSRVFNFCKLHWFNWFCDLVEIYEILLNNLWMLPCKWGCISLKGQTVAVRTWVLKKNGGLTDRQIMGWMHGETKTDKKSSRNYVRWKPQPIKANLCLIDNRRKSWKGGVSFTLLLSLPHRNVPTTQNNFSQSSSIRSSYMAPQTWPVMTHEAQGKDWTEEKFLGDHIWVSKDLKA